MNPSLKHIQGKRILLTRTAEQNQHTATLVAAFGATPVLLACTKISPLTQHIQQAWQALKQTNPQTTHIIFSSQNGVNAVAKTRPDFLDTLSAYTVVSVGEKTSQALLKHQISPAWEAQQASQTGLIQGYDIQDFPKTAFFFRAETGSDDLLHFLNTHNVQTHLIPAYRASLDNTSAAPIIHQLRANRIDAVLLGSARIAKFYTQKIDNIGLANHPVIAVMSQQVRKAADKLGLSVQVIAETPSFESMLKGLDDYFAHHEKG